MMKKCLALMLILLLAFTASYAEEAARSEEAAKSGEAAAAEKTATPDEAANSEKEAAAEKAARPEGTALISFVGDCSIGDAIQNERYANSYHTAIETNGYEWPFSLVKQYFEADDLTVANLEVVLTTRTRHKNKVFPLRGKPEFTEVLKAGSVEAVSTMNNHCEDFGRDGYKDTLDALDAGGILRFGCNRAGTRNGYDDLLVQELNGIRFGFMSFSYPQTTDIAKIEERAKKLREEEGCDIIVVGLHWGREVHNTPTNGQMSYAKKVIDAGADMIWGHHAHILQQINFYNGKPILYSTGNFTFGTMSVVDPQTGIFQLTWQREKDGTVDLKKLQVIPCETTRGPDYRPFPLTDEAEMKEVYGKLRFLKDKDGFVNLPESFLETGVVELNHGEFVSP